MPLAYDPSQYESREQRSAPSDLHLDALEEVYTQAGSIVDYKQPAVEV